MNLNFNLINEIISYIFFFIFFKIFIYPKIIKSINKYNIYYYKNNFFIKYNKTFNNFLKNKFLFMEKQTKKSIKIIINEINILLAKKKILLKKILIIEKKKTINKLKNNIKILNLFLFKKFIYKIKYIFLKSYKKIYNEIIIYNNNFILL
ncbi:MAG: hypothetical protein ACH6QR_00390 [Candidatus Carsonella ruddii]